MKVCIPVMGDEGLKSQVCAHFGSAPMFMLVETEDDSILALPNNNQHHGHGMCQPLSTLSGYDIGAMVVGGIGMGALMKLSSAGIDVYHADHATVAEVVAALKAGTLRKVSPDSACAHHGHGHH